MKTGTDDTDRNLKRNVINESEADLNSLLENATNFVVYRVTTDSSNPFGGRVVLVSPSIRAIAGLEDPYKFESWFENIHPEDADRIVDANQKPGKPGQFTIRFYAFSIRSSSSGYGCILYQPRFLTPKAT